MFTRDGFSRLYRYPVAREVCRESGEQHEAQGCNRDDSDGDRDSLRLIHDVISHPSRGPTPQDPGDGRPAGGFVFCGGAIMPGLGKMD